MSVDFVGTIMLLKYLISFLRICLSQVTYIYDFLDRAMQLDKKHIPEYVGTMEATIEIQSLQIVGFLSMVCMNIYHNTYIGK